MKTTKVNDALTRALNGRLMEKEYEIIKSYSKYVLYGYTFTLPKLLTVDDIISMAITKFYNARENFDHSIGKPITFFTTILTNEVKKQNMIYNKAANKIPENNFIINTM